MEVVEMINILDNIEVLYHSCIKINKEKIIYIDPYHIDKNYNDADIIFITHDHYDHYSEDDIDKIWDKFYKVDKARTREYGGNGIGLSIVKAIMNSFNRECGVNNCDDGVLFWFELDSSNA